jgi:hypothetical protein
LLAQLFGWLPAYRVLMAWVYDRSVSVLVAMLMHAVLTSGMIILTLTAISGVPLLTRLVVLAAVLWGVVAAVAVATGSSHDSRSGGRWLERGSSPSSSCHLAGSIGVLRELPNLPSDIRLQSPNSA